VDVEMSVPDLKTFQSQVSELLLRHRSLLDVLSKYQQTNSTVNRSVIKAITECGCIEVDAKKQIYDPGEKILSSDSEQLAHTHVNGLLCDACRDVVNAELGKNLFYMSALCNLLSVDLNEVLDKESRTCHTLGKFNKQASFL
jgi:hypothetical protein